MTKAMTFTSEYKNKQVRLPNNTAMGTSNNPTLAELGLQLSKRQAHVLLCHWRRDPCRIILIQHNPPQRVWWRARPQPELLLCCWVKLTYDTTVHPGAPCLVEGDEQGGSERHCADDAPQQAPVTLACFGVWVGVARMRFGAKRLQQLARQKPCRERRWGRGFKRAHGYVLDDCKAKTTARLKRLQG